MSNLLKNETSPYLIQHAENPVNWYPWCDEAFQKAKSEDKPVFLSIGYSTCHWCHVMAHESFEDLETAELLNKNFVSIKVDREERPDIDSVYMSVCQALTGSGGWPMSIFMTWDKKPFFAGTYFPVKPHHGYPGFSDILNTITREWNKNRGELSGYAEQLTRHLKNSESAGFEHSSDDLPQKSAKAFKHIFDSINGGFGGAPKFPTPHNLMFLMLYSQIHRDSQALKMAEKTLLQMRKGGIFDHIGYGFSRYSTDELFLVPHFEKMLYDNALLIMAYCAAYSITANPLYLDTAEKTAEYILSEMTSPSGGFMSAQDADSDGVEGKYYTFTLQEIISLLGPEGSRFVQAFDITENGNFEGVNIPNLLKSDALFEDFSSELNMLYDYRKKRTALHLDDKILTVWNALTIAAFSMLYRVSGSEKYLTAAKKACEFIENNLLENGFLYTSFRDGKRSKQGFLDDYAFFAAALLELYNSTLAKSFLEKAENLTRSAVSRFFDRENGGFFLCEALSHELFMNPKETYDGAIPSGNAVMAYVLLRVFQLTGRAEYKDVLEKQMAYLSQASSDSPVGHSMFLITKLMQENPPVQVTVALKEPADLSQVTKKLPFTANISVVCESAEYPIVNGQTTYYVCKDRTCLPPSNTLEI